MCAPLVVGILGALASAAGTAASIKNQQDQAAYDAKVAENNAKLAEQAANTASILGEIDKAEVSQEESRRIAAGRTTYAAGNVKLGSGSPLSWEIDTSEQAAIDREMVNYNSLLEQYGLRNQMRDFQASAKMTRRAGGQRAAASGLQGAGSLLDNSASLYANRKKS